MPLTAVAFQLNNTCNNTERVAVFDMFNFDVFFDGSDNRSRTYRVSKQRESTIHISLKNSQWIVSVINMYKLIQVLLGATFLFFFFLFKPHIERET